MWPHRGVSQNKNSQEQKVVAVVAGTVATVRVRHTSKLMKRLLPLRTSDKSLQTVSTGELEREGYKRC
jgi:hypothetical protein